MLRMAVGKLTASNSKPRDFIITGSRQNVLSIRAQQTLWRLGSSRAAITDICAFGDFLGRFSIGDELEVHCTGTKNRRIAKKIINKTTGSLVRPGLQIPALFIRLFSLIAALVVIWLAVTGIRLVTSGAIVSLVFGAVATLLGLVWQLLAAFGGSILGLIGIVIIIRSCLPRRK